MRAKRPEAMQRRLCQCSPTKFMTVMVVVMMIVVVVVMIVVAMMPTTTVITPIIVMSFCLKIAVTILLLFYHLPGTMYLHI